MSLRNFLLGGMLAACLVAANATPAAADWGRHNHGGPGWGQGPGHWDGHPYDNWHGHGWWDYGHRWHWYAGWGPSYGYVGRVPVWAPGIPVYAAPPPVYYAPPPPPPVYYAPAPPPPVYYAPPPPVLVAPAPSIVITPGGVGIAP